MQAIYLSQNQISLIDDDDFNNISKYTWSALWDKGTKSFYAATSIKGRKIYMHRMILRANQGEIVDHTNHYTLDNQKSNIHIVTTRENNSNLIGKLRGWYSSIYTGVIWNKQRNNWRARININGKLTHIGSYKTEIEAGEAYQAALLNINLQLLARRSQKTE